MSKPLVSIVILSFNGTEYLKDCLSSVLAQTYPDMEVIVVDNASEDGSPELVEEQFPSVRLIRNSSNLGFAAGNNVGIRLALGDYILLLNQDTRVDAYCLEELVEVASNDELTGICTPKLLAMNEPAQIDAVGILLYRDLSIMNRGIGEKDVGQYDCQEEVFATSGAASLYRRRMLKEIGLFDEDYFLLHEEDDLTWRARFVGWRCVYAPKAVVYHAHSASTGLYSPLKLYYGERNRIWVVAKFLPLPLIISSLLFTFRRYVAMARFGLTGKGPKAQVSRQHSLIRLGFALIRAWLDACRGLPKMMKKRRQIQRVKKVSNKEIKSWLKQYSATLRDVVER